MALKSKIMDHLFYLIMGTVYTYALSKSIITSTVVVLPNQTFISLSILFIFIFYVYFFNKYTSIFFTAMILFVAVFIYLSLAIDGFNSKWFIEQKEFINELYWFIRGYLPHSEKYDMALVVLSVFGVSFVAALSIKVKFNFYILTLFGGCIILIPLVMNYYRTDNTSIILSFCLLVFLAKKLNMSAKILKNKRNPEFSLALIPICACIILIARILPAPGVKAESDISVFAPSQAVDAVNDFFYTAFNPKYFSFQTAGFSERDGRLGGRVLATGSFVMEVDSSERVYLSGSIKDYYTGWSWTNTKAETFAVKDYEDFNYDFKSENDTHNIFNINNTKQVRINVGSSRTQTIFTPPNLKSIIFDSKVNLYKNAAGDLSLTKLISKNSGYTMEYVSNRYLSGLAENSSVYENNTWGDEFSAYLELPENLPLRIHELTDEIISKADKKTNFTIQISDEDVENILSAYSGDSIDFSFLDIITMRSDVGIATDYSKMKALEEYLHEFSYTLEPEDVPEGIDFVDYFLFTGKEGYCTYYASALAVMGRCAGIPTRYVEGYIMPPEKNENGMYEITSYQAHAWTEAYIRGVGWVAFEPTAPFAYSFYTAPQSVPSGIFSQSMYESDSYYQYMMEMGFAQLQPNTPVNNPVEETDDLNVPPGLIVTIIFGVLLFFIILFFIFTVMVLHRRIKFKRIEKTNNRDAVIAYFAHILKVAKVYTYPITKNETVFAYAKRVGKRFAFENEKIFMSDLAYIFSKASYSNNEISDNERLRMKNCYFEFLNMLKIYRLFKIQFIFYKYMGFI